MEPTFSLKSASLSTLTQTCYALAKSKGFHDKGRPSGSAISEKLMLIVGEVAEAQEELRAGHAPTETYFKSPTGSTIVGVVGKPDQQLASEGFKPEGFPIELADALIRILDLAGSLEIDLQSAVETKLAYNLTRPHKHNKVF